MNRFISRCAMAALCAFACMAQAAPGDGLGSLQQGLQKSIDRAQQGLDNAGGQLLGGLGSGSGQIGQGLDKAQQQLQQALDGSLNQSGQGLGLSITKLSGRYVDPTPGTVSFETSLSWQGLSRTVVVIRPDPLPAQPLPTLVLLHFDGGTPALMANLTHAGVLAAEQGYLVVLPAAIGGHWQDDPGVPSTIDDVGFLSRVIDYAVASQQADAERISMAGFSNGGFMTQRMGCERPELLAALLADAALLRNTEAAVCAPTIARPIVFVLGTSDVLVPYGGGNGMQSAADTYAQWARFNQCDAASEQRQDLPTVQADGTQVAVQRMGQCNSGGEVRLYTVTNGGHAWPGGEKYLGTNALGVTSLNLDTTRMLGQFAAQWTRSSTH